MPDMLVKLYALPDLQSALAGLREEGIEIRTAHASEKNEISGWVRHHFSDAWARTCEAALSARPGYCQIAVEKDRSFRATDNPYDLAGEWLLGFACYDVVARGMFGPEGVHPERRGKGIGKALLLSCLHRMAAEGYAYAIVGWAGPTAFYERTVSATAIQGSEPGIYRGKLRGVT